MIEDKNINGQKPPKKAKYIFAFFGGVFFYLFLMVVCYAGSSGYSTETPLPTAVTVLFTDTVNSAEAEVPPLPIFAVITALAV